MRHYAIAWSYHNCESSDYDDFGVCEQLFVSEEYAEEHMKKCVADDVQAWSKDGRKPAVRIEHDYARIEDRCGCYYEYRIIITRTELSNNKGETK